MKGDEIDKSTKNWAGKWIAGPFPPHYFLHCHRYKETQIHAKCKWCEDDILIGYDDVWHYCGLCLVAKIEKLDLPDITKQWLVGTLLHEPSGERY
jgi:hypothetical protein